MKLAYLILAHTLPDQLVRLVARLRHPDSDVYVHFDQRMAADDCNAAMNCLADAGPVRLVSPRYACRWGHFNLVGATLAGLETVRGEGKAYDYVFLLSGQDYPLKTQTQIRDVLAASSGKEYLDFFPLDEPNAWTQLGGRYQALRRVQSIHLLLPLVEKWLHIPVRRRLPNDMRPYGGSQWWTLSGRCISWILDHLQAHPDTVRHFRYAFIPDESFFQTLLLNSPFQHAIVNNNLRYFDFFRANPTAPAVMGVEDYDVLAYGTRALFARKFDVRRDPVILDRIDHELLGV